MEFVGIFSSVVDAAIATSPQYSSVEGKGYTYVVLLKNC
jgi:hypothetical protein